MDMKKMAGKQNFTVLTRDQFSQSHTFVASTEVLGFLITSSGLFALTLVFAGIDAVIKVLPPMIVFSPITVSPPSTEELE